jgi:DNA invertase Pin-like site-specific DNA recombinase
MVSRLKSMEAPLVSRAFSYIRFSSRKQQKGESYRRQSEFAVEICRENGWVLDESLTLDDLGVSAFRGANAKVGALGEFLEAIRIGRVLRGSILIIESIDRLSRNKVGEALQLFISILNSGVSIVTREPRRTYTQDSINDIAALLEPIIYMSRAHEESATKSFRLRDAWAKKKERAVQGLPMTRMAPRWLELTEQGYRLIPERAETVRAIFRMSADGLGVQRILNHLVAHPDQHPPFGDSGRWRDSYVQQILSNRAVYGEFQPGMRDERGQKIECGEPIRGYFPPVVSEDLFYQVQAGMKSRFRVLGRPGEYESNLFTGIVFHAEDRTRMSVHTFRQATRAGGETRPYRYLTSGATANGGIRRGNGLSFPYPPFEQAVLQALSELTPADIMGGEDEGDEREAEIADLGGKLVVMDHRIQDAEHKASDPDEETPEVYVGLLKALHKSKKEAVRRLEELKADAASCKAVNLGEVQSLLGLLGSVEGDELREVRRKLKARIRTVVSEIWVHITRVNHMQRVAQVQIHLKNGTRKHVVVQHSSGIRAKSRRST